MLKVFAEVLETEQKRVRRPDRADFRLATSLNLMDIGKKPEPVAAGRPRTSSLKSVSVRVSVNVATRGNPCRCLSPPCECKLLENEGTT